MPFGLARQYPKLSDRAAKSIVFQELENARARTFIDRVAVQMDSDQETETYVGVGNPPPMREWRGQKQYHRLNQFSFNVQNKDYEATMEVFEKDLRRDKTGQLRQKAAQMADRVLDHEEKLLSQLIDNGESNTYGTAFDGQNFFSNSHSVGNSGTIDNLIDVDVSALPVQTTGTASDPSTAAIAHAIMNGVRQIMQFNDDQGEPINHRVRSFVVMVPMELMDVAATAVSARRLSDNEPNPANGMDFEFNVIPNPRLTFTDAFVVLTNQRIKRPLLVQQEMDPDVQILGADSEWSFHNGSRLFSVVKAGNVSYNQFDQACKVNLV